MKFYSFIEATIDCYRCKSWNFTDKSCHDPFSKTTSALIERCTINMGTSEILVPANHCIKIIGTSVMTGEEYIVRDCTVDKIDHYCVYEQMDGEKIKKCIWTCNVNGCNKSDPRYQNGKPLLVIAQIIISLYLSPRIMH